MFQNNLELDNKMKPILACEVPLDKINLPVYCSVKLDGIRCIAIQGVAYSRSMKPIRNKFIQSYFKEHNLHGLDGELCVGNNFQESTSGIMSIDGEPDFTYHVFDFWDSGLMYINRLAFLCVCVWPSRINILDQEKCSTIEAIQFCHDVALIAGYEGLIVRSIMAPYKQGRSSPKEQYLIKYKPHADSEAVIIGFEEQKENTNIVTFNEIGYSQRSCEKDGYIGKDTLGSFTVCNDEFGEFSVGTGIGLDIPLRAEIWANKDKYIGKIIKFKYQPFGVKDKPRFPVFIGFRDGDDL